MGTMRPDATSLSLVPRVDTRSHGVLDRETDLSDHRQKSLSQNFVREILFDPDQDNLIQESQESDHKYTPLSEAAKKKMHPQGNVEFFELRIVRGKCNAAIVCAALHSGSLIFGTAQFSQRNTQTSEALERRFDLNQQWFNWFTIPHYT